MRDVLLLLFMICAIPPALIHPVYGIYLWVWISVMNPHRLTWGFAYDLPLGLYTAVATLIGLVVTRDQRRLPIASPTVVLFLFLIWMTLGYPFAFFPEASYPMWNKVMKIYVMTLVAAALVVEREHVKRMVWVIAISLGFYGVKGGIYTLRGGGSGMVWGPAGSFIEGNNEVALAFVLVIPLMWFLYEITTTRWIKVSLVASMALTGVAALGSQSRGALLAIAAMSIALFWYTKRKVLLGAGLFLFWPLMLAFMPETWETRMATISTYEADGSAMGRIYAWWTMWNLAKDRPFFGGGFAIYEESVFKLYQIVPDAARAAHSIYFQVLGEHGFVGLFLFILIWWFTWRTAVWIRKRTTAIGENSWAYHLAAMSQVSMVGYFVGGAFLSLAYFDLPYYIMVALVATKLILERERKSPPTTVRSNAAGGVATAAQLSEAVRRAPGHGA